MLRDLIARSRSYRRFDESVPVPMETLKKLVGLARLSPSASNKQPLKFRLVNDPDTNAKVFSCLAWAGYLTDWKGPAEGERPAAYVVMLGDTVLSNGFATDEGIMAQSMMLGAVEAGFGGCMLGAINRPRLRELLEIPERYEILLVLALGKPVETVVIDPVDEDGSIKYWRDAQQVHHVPKRSLDELILG
ncbi:MAG: nitroreductase family protein [Anaerolineae bacterium]|nr:nitroreductase family protein [Anaerolineae bacterium]